MNTDLCGAVQRDERRRRKKRKNQDPFSFAKPVVNLTPDEEDGREKGNMSGGCGRANVGAKRVVARTARRARGGPRR